MQQIGPRNLELSLENHVGSVRDFGYVDAGALVNSIPVSNKSWINNQHQNFLIQILSGNAIYEWSVITANTSNTLTINPALSVAPSVGDKIVIYNFASSGGGPAAPVDIQEWGGTALTGADITPFIQNLDLALTALRDALLGLSSKTLTDLDTDLTNILNSILGATAGTTVTIATAANISGGVTSALSNYKNWSLYFNVAGAIDITVELSPDGGATYYDIDESPISFAGAGDAVYEIGYTANYIRLTGSDGTLVTAQVRGKF